MRTPSLLPMGSSTNLLTSYPPIHLGAHVFPPVNGVEYFFVGVINIFGIFLWSVVQGALHVLTYLVLTYLLADAPTYD